MAERSETWWMLYPLRGLEITDEKNGFDTPIFGDVTLVSKDHVEQYFHAHNHSEQVTKMAEFWFGHQMRDKFYQSFVAIRRTGIVENDDEEEEDSELGGDAKDRAYQISALLAIVFLCKSKSKKTCGLAEQMHKQIRSNIGFTEAGNFTFDMGGMGHSYTIGSHPQDHIIKLSRKEVMLALNETPFRSLSEALLLQTPSLPKSLSRTITLSAIRLSDAIFSATPSAQLLGAVIAMEILFASQTDKYDTLKQRASVLLGGKEVIERKLDSAIRSRNMYVHQGEDINPSSLSRNAIEIALLSILHYAEAAKLFQSKEKFMEYLDFIFRGNALSGNWSEEEHIAFKELQKHDERSLRIPFFGASEDVRKTVD